MSPDSSATSGMPRQVPPDVFGLPFTSDRHGRLTFESPLQERRRGDEEALSCGLSSAGIVGTDAAGTLRCRFSGLPWTPGSLGTPGNDPRTLWIASLLPQAWD